MNREEIRNFIRLHGVRGFQEGFSALIDGRQMPNGAVVKIDPKTISFRELWEGCVGSIHSTFDNATWRSEASGGGSLDPTGFPIATEKLLNTLTISAYDSVQRIADILVPNSETPGTLTEHIPGFTAAEGPKRIRPGEKYPRTGFTDKYVTFQEAVYDRKEGIEIAITEEVIRFDQTRSIMRRAEQIGNALSTERERRTVRAVLGIGADTGTTIAGVYYPSGVDTPLYAAGANNLRTDAAPIYTDPGHPADSKFMDYTDIQEVLALHAKYMTDDRTLGAGRPIVWTPNRILFPVAMRATAANVMFASTVTHIPLLGSSTLSATAGPEIRNTVRNPISDLFMGTIPQPLSSPFVDEVSTTMWTMFDTDKTFVRIVVFPFQTYRAPVGYGWNSDLVFAMRVREWSGVIALERILAIRSNGA